ncbi:alpha/beta hydrolase [Acuticoccus mangrovi]|uniref:Alpha/beta hydrolase n=1 Tax=Acuticoccus mangrovi TaxID=2796142 RepID=A0A934MHF8_9HYPH|nr:alpha/beta fold hydrolase [Acuticoccus mangrovi]MBJ3777613.1 alpha/beta hydrolase [Acuticoccus mangrovi]
MTLTAEHAVVLAGSAGPMTVHVRRPAGTARGTLILAHGRNGAAAAPHLVPILAAATERGLVTVAPDLCHSANNDSAGAACDFTMAAHLADVATVVEWAEAAEPACPRLLAGHSMGAYAALRLAARHPAHLRGVLAVAPVISGTALFAARQAMGPDALPALFQEVAAAHDEWPRHDLAAVAPLVDVPVAIIVGADDAVTPPAHAHRLAGWLGTRAHVDVIPGEPHSPLGPAYVASVGHALDRLLG